MSELCVGLTELVVNGLVNDGGISMWMMNDGDASRDLRAGSETPRWRPGLGRAAGAPVKAPSTEGEVRRRRRRPAENRRPIGQDGRVAEELLDAEVRMLSPR